MKRTRKKLGAKKKKTRKITMEIALLTINLSASVPGTHGQQARCRESLSLSGQRPLGVNGRAATARHSENCVYTDAPKRVASLYSFPCDASDIQIRESVLSVRAKSFTWHRQQFFFYRAVYSSRDTTFATHRGFQGTAS